jgi:glucan biosynthesis protein
MKIKRSIAVEVDMENFVSTGLSSVKDMMCEAVQCSETSLAEVTGYMADNIMNVAEKLAAENYVEAYELLVEALKDGAIIPAIPAPLMDILENEEDDFIIKFYGKGVYAGSLKSSEVMF